MCIAMERVVQYRPCKLLRVTYGLYEESVRHLLGPQIPQSMMTLHVSGEAMPPLHSAESPPKGHKIRTGYLTLACFGPKKRRKCYVTPAFSGVPNTKRWHHNQKSLPHPFLLGGPKHGGNPTSPMHSRGSPTKGNKIRSGCLTLAFSGAQKTPEMLCHCCTLGGPQQKGIKIRSGYPTLAFSGAQKTRCCLAIGVAWP